MALKNEGYFVIGNLRNTSDAFLSARALGRSLSQYPGPLPKTMEEAYRLQDLSVSRWPDQVQGWKIGLVPPEFRGEVGCERLVGPIFSHLVRQNAPGKRLEMPVFAGGFAAVEAEFVFCLGQDVPDVGAVDEALLRQIGGSLHVGVEIASSPFAGINDLGPLCVVSDFGNNNGLIVGAEIPDWQSVSAEDMSARVEIDGVCVGEATAAAIPGGPIGALAFVVTLMRSRGIALKAGMYISTGAVTGVHSAKIGAEATVQFAGRDKFDLVLTEFSVQPEVVARP